MKKLKIYVSMLAMATMLFATSCVNDNESPTVTNLRGARAEQMKAQADYDKARAAAETVTANANAKYLEAQAAVQNAMALKAKADADIAAAEAKIRQAEADMKAIELAIAQGAKEDDIKARIAEAQAKAAQAAADLANAQASEQNAKNMLEEAKAQMELIKIKAAADLEAAKIQAQITLAGLQARLAEAKADVERRIGNLIDQYSVLLNSVNLKQNEINNNALDIARQETDIKLAKITGDVNDTRHINNLNANIEKTQATIDAKKDELELWTGLKVEEVEATIKTETAALNTLREQRNTAYNQWQPTIQPKDDAINAYDEFVVSLTSIDYTYAYKYLDNNGVEQEYKLNSYIGSTYSFYCETNNHNYYYRNGTVGEIEIIKQMANEDIKYYNGNLTKAKDALKDSTAKFAATGTNLIDAKKKLDDYKKTWIDKYKELTATPPLSTVAAFEKIDSTYCDHYRKYYGGTANGWGEQRPDGYSYTPSHLYNGKTYAEGVYTIYSRLENNIYVLNADIRMYNNDLARLNAIVAAADDMIAKLKGTEKATLFAAMNTAIDNESAKKEAYEDLNAQVTEKETSINDMKWITTILGPNPDNPDYTLSIDYIKNKIEDLKSEIKYNEEQLTALELDLTTFNENKELDATIKQMENQLARLISEKENLERQKSDLKAKADALKIIIDAALNAAK